MRNLNTESATAPQAGGPQNGGDSLATRQLFGSGSLSKRTIALIILLAIFFFISVLWAITIKIPAESINAPTWDGFNPDEQAHLRYVAYIASHLSLPPFNDWYYTAVHPPLYYMCMAPIYGLLSKFLPLSSVVLILRFIGAGIGTLTVYLIYRTARAILPANTALLAAGVVASVPMFVSLSASVSNEVSAACMAAGAIWVITCGLRAGFTIRRTVILGLWIAAGCATKVTCLCLFPAAFLALVLAPRRHTGTGSAGSRGRDLLIRAGILIGISVVLSGWWFLRNLIVYGDPLLAAAHQHLWNADGHNSYQTMMTTPQFCFNCSYSGWESFWGIFDAFRRPLPTVIYIFLIYLQLAAIIGFLIFCVRLALRHRQRHGAIGRCMSVLGLFWFLELALFYYINTRIYAPQGRYLFPTLPPFAIATAAGWLGLAPRRLRGALATLLLIALFLMNLLAFATSSRPKDADPPPSVGPQGRTLPDLEYRFPNA